MKIRTFVILFLSLIFAFAVSACDDSAVHEPPPPGEPPGPPPGPEPSANLSVGSIKLVRMDTGEEMNLDAAGIPLNVKVKILFNVAASVDATIDAVLLKNNVSVDKTIEWVGDRTALFMIPSSNLDAATDYSVRVMSESGGGLLSIVPAGTTTSFRTGPGEAPPPPLALAITNLKLVRLDNTELSLASTYPIPVRVKVKATFNRDLGATEAVALNLLYSETPSPVSVPVIAWTQTRPNGSAVIFEPSINLAAGTTYYIQITAGGAAVANPGIANSFRTMVAGDVNGDGKPDVLAGAPGFDSNKGGAVLYDGASISAGISVRLATFLRESCGMSATGWMEFGFSVAIAGDVDADGYADMAISALGSSLPSQGVVCVYKGGVRSAAESGVGLTPFPLLAKMSGSAITGSSRFFGWSIANAGDVNGDGFSDLIVGDKDSGNGRAHIFQGQTRASADTTSLPLFSTITAPASVPPSPLPHYFGYSVAGAGDIDGDNLSDVIVGAPGMAASEVGKAYIFKGAATVASAASLPFVQTIGVRYFDAPVIGDQFGYSVSAAGDVNGDGRTDVVVGAPGMDTNTGKAYVYAGTTSGSVQLFAMLLPAAGSGLKFGRSVTGLGKLNGDNLSDILVGAPGDGTANGKIFLFAGASAVTGGSLVQLIPPITGEASFGSSVALLGYADDDLLSDFAVGSPMAAGRGLVKIYKGNACSISSDPATFCTPTSFSEIATLEEAVGAAGAKLGQSIGGVGLAR